MPALVSLPERVCLPAISAQHSALQAAFAQEGDIEIDASALIEGDISLIQLILAAKAQAERESRSLRLTAPANPALTALLARIGINPTSPPDIAFWHHGEIAA